MDPLTGLFLFGLYKVTEKVWDKAFDAALEPLKEAIKTKGKRWAGKGSEVQIQEAMTEAAFAAREYMLENASDPKLAKQVIHILTDASHQDLLLALAEEGSKLLSSLKKPDVRRLSALCQEHLKWEAIYAKTTPPDTKDVVNVLAELLTAMREALTDQPTFQHLIAKEQRDYLREIRDVLVSTPQYATEADYRSQVIAVDGSLDFTGIAVVGRRDAVRVDELFAHLKFKAEEEKIVSERNLGESEIDSQEQENQVMRFPMRFPLIFRGKRQPVLVDLPEALRRQIPLVILGDPGSGKTTLLKYLAVKAALDEAAPEFGLDVLENGAYLPVFTSLRGFSAEADRPQNYSLLDYFHTQAYERYSLDLPPDFFKDALNKKRCLVLLDGLDEVWERGHRVEVRDAVHALVSRYPGNRFVIASRIAGYESAPLDRATYLHYSVQPLGDEEIKAFVSTWYKLREPDLKQRGEFTKGLIETLENRPNILDLARNPLLLTIIALVHRNEADLPQDRTTLYEKCVQTLLEEWEGRKRLTTVEKSRPYYNHRLDLLQLLAFDLHLAAEQPRQLQLISRDEIENRLAKYLYEDLGLFPNLRQARPDAQSFVQFIAARNGLLVERGQDEFSFPHLTFQEYLAAMEIKTRTGGDPSEVWEIIRDHLHKSHWREVILLLLGMLGKSSRGRNSTKLVEFILQAGETDPYEGVLYRCLFLAAAVCADRVLLSADITQTIVGKLLDLIHDAPFEDLRLDIINLLGTLEDNQQISEALFALALYPYEENLRNAAVQSLVQLGGTDKTVVERLLALTNDPFVEHDLRRIVAQCLGQLGYIGDAISVLLILARDVNVESAVRCDAAQSLSHLGRTEDAIAILFALARDANVKGFVRIASAQSLSHLGYSNDAVEILLALARYTDFKNLESLTATQRISELGRAESTVVEALISLARDAQVNKYVRREAVKGLGKLGPTDNVVVESLLTLANDTLVSPHVRCAAANSLTQLGLTDNIVVESLLTLARDAHMDTSVRYIAVEGLRRLGYTDDAVVVLLAIARDAQVGEDLRCEAAIGLGELGYTDDARAILLTIARNAKEGYFSYEAAVGLGELGYTNDAVAILLTIVRNTVEYDFVRNYAYHSLKQLAGI